MRRDLIACSIIVKALKVHIRLLPTVSSPLVVESSSIALDVSDGLLSSTHSAQYVLVLLCVLVGDESAFDESVLYVLE